MAKKRPKDGSEDFDLKFDFASLTFRDDEKEPDPETESALVEVPKLSLRPVAFENAEDFVEDIEYGKDYFAFLSGSFIFGDCLEALIFQKDLNPKAVYISTLGMSDENADSLVNMTGWLGCEKLNLIVSHWFAGTERHGLMQYIKDEFAGQPIDIAVLQSHSKVCLIRSDKGDIAIAGSANLSSSNNVEQIIITHDPGLIDFLQRRLDYIMEHFTVYRGKDEEPRIDWKKNRKNIGKYAWRAINGWGEE